MAEDSFLPSEIARLVLGMNTCSNCPCFVFVDILLLQLFNNKVLVVCFHEFVKNNGICSLHSLTVSDHKKIEVQSDLSHILSNWLFITALIIYWQWQSQELASVTPDQSVVVRLFRRNVTKTNTLFRRFFPWSFENETTQILYQNMLRYFMVKNIPLMIT